MRMRVALSISIAALAAFGLVGVAQVKDLHPSEVANFRPVTEAMLRNPPPEDWVNWRRTDNNWGYSPLAEINNKNVQQMQLAWSWAMDLGDNQPGPLVHDGIMYLPNPDGVIQALDGATGDLIWEYRPQRPAAAAAGRGAPPAAGGRGVQPAPAGVTRAGGSDRHRNIAIFGDRLFSAIGAHIVAVNAKTGKLVWDTTTADSTLGFQYTAGPIVVRGKVIAGITGCTRYKEDVCFIAGLDAETGKEIWRTATVPKPGEPGGDTWGDLPLVFRAGGDMWVTGSYDPETNLIYWGTAQAKPWARAVRGTGDGAALYTNCTLALDPDTGKMKWYYQHIPGETQDMDEVFERILVDVGGRKSMFTMGKLAILWQLDRVTGAFVHAYDMGYQNILKVDPQSGKVTYNPGMIPEIGVPLDMCPNTAGFKAQRAMAYHPQTSAFYIPILMSCENAIFGPVERVRGGGSSGPVKRKDYILPQADGNLGEFLALDTSGKVLWRHRQSSPMNSAALTTAGGLAFVGDWDRHMYAFDAVTGKILWQTRLPTSAQGYPMTYSVRGKQYVAVTAGVGGSSWAMSVVPALRPDIRRPTVGNSLLVFALPGDAGAKSGSSAQ